MVANTQGAPPPPPGSLAGRTPLRRQRQRRRARTPPPPRRRRAAATQRQIARSVRQQSGDQVRQSPRVRPSIDRWSHRRRRSLSRTESHEAQPRPRAVGCSASQSRGGGGGDGCSRLRTAAGGAADDATTAARFPPAAAELRCGAAMHSSERAAVAAAPRAAPPLIVADVVVKRCIRPHTTSGVRGLRAAACSGAGGASGLDEGESREWHAGAAACRGTTSTATLHPHRHNGGCWRRPSPRRDSTRRCRQRACWRTRCTVVCHARLGWTASLRAWARVAERAVLRAGHGSLALAGYARATSRAAGVPRPGAGIFVALGRGGGTSSWCKGGGDRGVQPTDLRAPRHLYCHAPRAVRADEYPDDVRVRRGTFDAAFAISSLDHDGLGRYGDPVNPFADFQAMERLACLGCRSSVPVGAMWTRCTCVELAPTIWAQTPPRTAEGLARTRYRDSSLLYIEHLVSPADAQALRLGLWDFAERYGWHEERLDVDADVRQSYEPVFVLTPQSSSAHSAE
eukprot:scaffold1564_cov389-Prasinococcus_capsulatus_cf.AAC.28